MASSWFTSFGGSATGNVSLLCLAGAGAYASEFRSWPQAMGGLVDVRAILLPGRERRIREPSIATMPELVDALAEAMRPWTNEPVALFGHSSGALVMFELARRLSRTDSAEVSHLFVSGQPGPKIRPPCPPASSSDDELIEYIRSLGGAPDDVLANRAFMRAYFPGMRADLAVYEGYLVDQDRSLLDCPITAFAGARDTETTPADIDTWRRETTGPFRLAVLPGDHFFLRTLLPVLADEILHSLLERTP
jgi:medium-chain acyl-[acyl-carrier-protein] hydrolase